MYHNLVEEPTKYSYMYLTKGINDLHRPPIIGSLLSLYHIDW
jgi:hypothetical protein